MADPIKHKVARLHRHGRPRVLDLFSGCGGMTLGFARAGCESLGGVELDQDAASTFSLNFHDGKDVHRSPRDIRETEPRHLLRAFGHEADDVDVIVGGPPCPAFTRVGRAKLREVHDHPEAFRHDPRARLYESYLHFVEALRPVALVMENVPDILNWGGHNLGEEISDRLERLGYVPRYTLLNAVHYGVPQVRERFFLVAVHTDVGGTFAFPTPSHAFTLPRGYESSRTVALRTLQGVNALSRFFVPTPQSQPELAQAVTVRDAIADLPVIDVDSIEYRKRGARDPARPTSYRPGVHASAYSALLRRWPGFESNGHVTGQVTRCLTDRDHRIFAAMKPHDEYPEAYATAERLFETECARQQLGRGGRRRLALRRAYVPPYDPLKYPNKWWKMGAGKPARTLMAHLGKDSYSHIHYAQPRVLTVREAARLQSFPDGFQLCGRMNSAFRQIGNAVPPLLAHALAVALHRHLCRQDRLEVRPPSPTQAASRPCAS